MPEIISRTDAKQAGLKRYYTGEPCLYGHVAERLVQPNWCVECKKNRGRAFDANNRQKRRDAVKRFASSAPLVRRERELLRKYGITIAEWDILFESQERCCAICGESESRAWHTDHCHSSGIVRGILCRNCNIALGLVRDSIPSLMKMVRYLEKSAGLRPLYEQVNTELGESFRCLSEFELEAFAGRRLAINDRH